MLETLTDALVRWRAQGYADTFSATEDGMFRCGKCGRVMDPDEVTIRHRQRFEGATNPDDQDLLLALECTCGCRGVYTTGYGPNAPAADAAVLRKLAGRTTD